VDVEPLVCEVLMPPSWIRAQVTGSLRHAARSAAGVGTGILLMIRPRAERQVTADSVGVGDSPATRIA
jgi:hypothetical protein